MGQGYVHTQVEGDRTVDLKPGQMYNAPEVELSEIVNHYLTNSQLWYVNEQAKQWAGVRMEEGLLTDPELIAANTRLNGEGIKHDEGKDRWDLLPPSIQKVVEVYTIGAAKYDDDNWAKGMGYRRIFGAMMRHAWKWFWGESYDQQDGQHHLASVAWACLTLMHYEDEGVGTDDRAFKPMDREVPPPAYELTGWDASADFQGPKDEPVYEAKPYGFEVTKHPDGTTTIEPIGH